MTREELGRLVRVAWVRWAEKCGSPKASWLLPWEKLSEFDKEADRQIGEAVAAAIGTAAHGGEYNPRKRMEELLDERAALRATVEALKAEVGGLHNVATSLGRVEQAARKVAACELLTGPAMDALRAALRGL